METTEQAGPWAYDVFFGMRPSPLAGKTSTGTTAQAPGTIDGSKNPELIPTEVAFNIFLRVASCPTNATPLQQKKCRLVRRAVGLQGDDDVKLSAELASLAATIQPLDEKIARLHGTNDDSSQAVKKLLADQRRGLLKSTAQLLQQKLSDRGRQQLGAFVSTLKTKITVVTPVAQ